MREWIEAIADGGRRRLADGLMSVDLELVSLLLRQYLRVHRVDEPKENTDAPSNRFVQFDEHYLIEFIRHDSSSPICSISSKKRSSAITTTSRA